MLSWQKTLLEIEVTISLLFSDWRVNFKVGKV